MVLSGASSWQCSTALVKINPHGQESLKIHYIEFDIAVPLCKMYTEYIMLKIKMRPYNSVGMSIRCSVSIYCTPMITWSWKFNVENIRRIVFSVITVYDRWIDLVTILLTEWTRSLMDRLKVLGLDMNTFSLDQTKSVTGTMDAYLNILLTRELA